MDLQLGTNVTTYYIIFPLLIIIAALIVWLVTKIKVSIGKKVALVLLGILAFAGSVTMTLWIYYQVDDHFSGTFNLYAYSALAPGADPFLQSDGYYGPVLAMSEAQVRNGEVRWLESPDSSSIDHAWQLFLPGRWVTVGESNRVLATREGDPFFPGPHEVQTTLWWALTKDIYTGVGDASNVEPESSTITRVSSHDISISPDGKYAVFVENSTAEPYRSVKRKDLQTGTEYVMTTSNAQYKYYDFTWYGDSRIYYIKYGKINSVNGYASLQFQDVSDADPLVVTEVVFEDPDMIMQGQVRIVGVGEGILYIQKDNNIYSVNLTEGAAAIPELVVDIENI